MIFEIFDCIFGEILMAVALVPQGARVVENEAPKFNFQPGRGRGIYVKLDNDLCNSRDYNPSVLLTTQIHSLVFELRELFIKLLYC